jgi:Flp pilus assembly protein TadG
MRLFQGGWRSIAAISRLSRSDRGGVAVETAICALIVMTVLFGTIDALVATSLGAATDSAAYAAGRVLAVTRDQAAATAAARRAMPVFGASCLSEPSYRVYDDFSLRPSNSSSGYVPGAGVLPPTAIAAKVTLVCDWKWMTPFMAMASSSGATIRRVAFVGLE